MNTALWVAIKTLRENSFGDRSCLEDMVAALPSARTRQRTEPFRRWIFSSRQVENLKILSLRPEILVYFARVARYK
jgi:hypothetical protein